MEDMYGPEDIEQLLLAKSFKELYPEEREYVLKHVTDANEYEQLRSMLGDLQGEEENPLRPPTAMRASLIEQHEQRHRKGSIKIWLNSLFSAITPSFEWKRPAFQLAAIAGILLSIFLIFKKDINHVADLNVAEEEKDDVLADQEFGNLYLDTIVNLESKPDQLEAEETELDTPTDNGVVEEFEIEASDMVVLNEEPKREIHNFDQIVVEVVEEESEVVSSEELADRNYSDFTYTVEDNEADEEMESAVAEELSSTPASTTSVSRNNGYEKLEIESDKYKESELGQPISPILLSSLYTSW